MDQLIVYPSFESHSRHSNKFFHGIQQHYHSKCTWSESKRCHVSWVPFHFWIMENTPQYYNPKMEIRDMSGTCYVSSHHFTAPNTSFLKNFQLPHMQHIMAQLVSTCCYTATYTWEIYQLKYQPVQLTAMRISPVTPGKCDVSSRWNMKYRPVYTALLNDLWMDTAKRCVHSCIF